MVKFALEQARWPDGFRLPTFVTGKEYGLIIGRRHQGVYPVPELSCIKPPSRPVHLGGNES